MTTAPDSVPLRCSTFARLVELDPVGSAGSYDLFVLVEHPLPWPRDVSELPLLASAHEAAARSAPGSPIRLQALAMDEHTPPVHRVIVYRRAPGSRPGFTGREARVPAAEVPEAVAELARGGGGQPVTARDVLVCTHGRRDVCCGSRGTELFAAAATLSPDPSLRWWRTSHTGGHRFAPTAILLPEGQMWAYLDPRVLAGILDRSGDVPAGHYRGSAAFPSPAVQAVEREAFAAQGWSWLDCTRRGWEESRDGGAVTAVVEYQTPSGRRGTYRGAVTVTRMVPVLDCGRPVEEAKKSEPELRVDSLSHQPG